MVAGLTVIRRDHQGMAMARRRRASERGFRVRVELLEDRSVPVTFGVPWPDASLLTLSFAPDGTGIAGHQSQLFQALNAQMPTAVWQKQILSALQTWAVNANINIGVIPDGGQPFGAPGLTQGDARFGDIRVGAQPMAASALSVSVPYDPAVAGTWAGDVLLNSNDSFGGNASSLYTVALHEAGHVFGLSDTTDPNSAMYQNDNQAQYLSSGDVWALQSLYGKRSPDQYDLSGGNDSISKATQIGLSNGFDGSTPIVRFGDITTTSDVDFYAFKSISGYTGPITFRVQTAGISLLAPSVTIYDASGKVLGQSQSNSGMGDMVFVQVPNSDPSTTYFVKVQGASQDVFGIGNYGLAITLDAKLTTSATALNNVLLGPYRNLSPNDLDMLFRAPTTTLVNNNLDTNNTLDSAITLNTPVGYVQNSHYSVSASLSTGDVDTYRIKAASAPNGSTNAMIVRMRGLDTNGPVPWVAVFDNNKNPIAAQVLANDGGFYTIQVPAVTSGADLFLSVQADPNAAKTTGNYGMMVDFSNTPIQLTTFASGSFASPGGTSGAFYVAQNQLFDFVLSANAAGAAPGESVRMTITDSTGQVVVDLTAPAGDTVSTSPLLILPGAYTVTYVAQASGTAAYVPLSFALQGATLSDPIGPALTDTTLQPLYVYPYDPTLFAYPGGYITSSPYYFTITL